MGKKSKKKEKKSTAKANGADIGTRGRNSTDKANIEQLRVMTRKYPWFDSAVIASSGGDINVLPKHILLQKSFRPSLIMHWAPTASEPTPKGGEPTVSDMRPTAEWIGSTAGTPDAMVITCGQEAECNSASGECYPEPATKHESELNPASDPFAGEPTPSTIDIIDCFIDKGEHKVVATDETPEFISEDIPTSTFEGLPEDDELITEELAEVYLNQGLFEQAKAIYERLSLLYPKKSVYFAEIIEKADRGRSTAKSNN